MTDFELRVDPPLRDLRRALKRAGDKLPRELTKANRAAAGFIADEARARYRTLYTQITGGSAKSIRPFASATRAQVGLGSAKQPHLAGQEFGSQKFRQFFPWTGPAPGGVGSKGRFFWPTVREKAGELAERYGKLLGEVTSKAFPRKGKR